MTPLYTRKKQKRPPMIRTMKSDLESNAEHRVSISLPYVYNFSEKFIFLLLVIDIFAATMWLHDQEAQKIADTSTLNTPPVETVQQDIETFSQTPENQTKIATKEEQKRIQKQIQAMLTAKENQPHLTPLPAKK